MIIIQTPLRVSLFGGGTDFPEYYLAHGGCVLSTSIDKYIFVTIKRRFDNLLRVGYTKTELVESVDQIEHELIRQAFRRTGLNQGVEITTMGDIPSAGSGLGSSGTVTVGALHSMYTYLGESVTAKTLAEDACSIEIDELKKPVGVQDQYIAAYGGFRWMDFAADGQIHIQKLAIGQEKIQELNERLLLFYTGVTRASSSVLDEQENNIGAKSGVLSEMKDIAKAAKKNILAGDFDQVGDLLHQSWLLKTSLASNISNGTIDEMYQSARSAGALGGKITGAGGGGFFLVWCPEGKRQAVRHAMNGLRELPFQFEPDGSKVIFNYRRN